MQRVFFRNLTYLIALNVLIKPLWILGIDRTVQNTVGQESYGLYFVLFNLSFLTQILLDLGISNFNNRELAQQHHLLENYLSNIFSVKLILAFIYLIVTFLIGALLHYNSYQLYLLFIICLNQALASLIVYVRTNISALHHFVIDSTISVLDKALMIFICGFLLLSTSFKSHFQIEWFIYSQTIAYLITLIGALFYVLKLTRKISFKFSKQFSFSLLKKAFPFATLIALMALYSKLDGVMIQKLLPGTGEKEAGIYASAYRLLDALNQFGYLFAVLLLPIFSRMLARKQTVDQLVKTSFTVIFIGAFTAAIALCFYSKEIMSMLYKDADSYSAKILSTLIFCFIGTASVFIFGTLLTANGNLKELIAISFLAVVCNIILNYVLIPMHHALGAAESAITTQLFIAVLNGWVSTKIFRWKADWGLIARLSIFITGTIALFYFGKDIHINWMTCFVLLSVSSLLLAFMLRLFDVRSIIALLKSNEV